MEAGKYTGKLTVELFNAFIEELEKIEPPKHIPIMKVFTGEQGAINVARRCIQGMGKDNPSDEECLQFARSHFEWNGRGAYII